MGILSVHRIRGCKGASRIDPSTNLDYLGLAGWFKHACANYAESGGKGGPTYDTKQAIAVMLEKHCIACDRVHGFK